MTLFERFQHITATAQGIRESMTVVDPRVTPLDTGSERGDRRIGANNNKAWLQKVTEAARLLADVYSGKRPLWHLQEAMSTSDFPYLFGDTLYRGMVGNYEAWPVTYPAYFKIRDVNDLRTINLMHLDGGQGRLAGPLKQYEPYPEINFTEGRYQLSVAKYGHRYGISLEMLINDDQDAFQSRPFMMADGARRSEEYLATQQLVDVNGPHASFYTAGNGNIVTGNPALSITGFQTAFGQLRAMKDSNNDPIQIDMVTLVVTPADEIAARNILNATELRIYSATGGGGGAGYELITQNWMKNKVRLVVNPYLTVVASSETTNNWFLVASPSNPAQRAAFYFGFLRGRRQPQLFIKDPDARALGGGGINPAEGSFDSDSIDYKIRHFFGAAQGDPKMSVASSGSGQA